jgi:GT2 family glycosyltransferase
VSLAVIIPSLNTRDLLHTTLDTLLPQLVDVDAEVVVVDMSSTDGTLEMLDGEFDRVRVLRDVPNAGYGAAVNAGVQATVSRWILACNSDLEFREAGSVRALLEAGETLEHGAVFGARLSSSDGTAAHSAFRLPGRYFFAATFCAPLRYLKRLNARALGYVDDSGMREPTKVGWVSGALLLLRRSALETVGGFDEAFFMNCEEVDLCARVLAAGWDVFLVPGASVVHCGGGSTSGRRRGLVWLAEGQARYTRKHFGPAARGVAFALAWLGYASSLPVWAARAVFGRQSFAEAGAEARDYAAALTAAARV